LAHVLRAIYCAIVHVPGAATPDPALVQKSGVLHLPSFLSAENMTIYWLIRIRLKKSRLGKVAPRVPVFGNARAD
jgi:hypothetical protein